MTHTWAKVSPDQARQHKLYGVGGWLLVFAIGSALGVLKSYGMLGGEAAKAGMTIGQLLDIDHPAITFAKITMWLEGIALAVLYWALFTKQSAFRIIATVIAAGLFPLQAVIGFSNPFEGLGNAMAVGMLQWIVSCAIWLSYLHRSRRVRVTFEHCVRSDEISSSPPSMANMQEARSAHKVAFPTGPYHSSPATSNAIMPVDANHQPTFNHQPPVTPMQNTSISTMPQAFSCDEDAVYEVVAEEMESGKMDKGLWTRLYAEHDGDEKKTKIAYIKQRAERLMAVERARIQELARQQAEEAERVERLRLEGLSIREKLSPSNLTLELLETIKQLSSTSEALTFLSNVRLNKIDQVIAKLEENPLYIAVATSEGASALHLAVGERYFAMSKLLIGRGAQVDQPNSSGQTPLDLALKSGRQDLIDMLSSI